MRTPQPFYWQSHKAWYLNLNGKKIRLTPRGVNCTETDKEAQQAARQEYHRIMASGQPMKADCQVVDLIDAFLAHKKEDPDLKPGTYQFYAPALTGRGSFGRFVGKRRVSEVTEQLVDNWIKTHATVKRATPKGLVDTGRKTSANYRYNLLRAVRAVFRYGQRKHRIPNPIEGIRLPTPEARNTYLSSNQWAKVVAVLEKSDVCLLDLLTVLRETGCRPREARQAEARHLDGHRLVFPQVESKGRRKTRVVKLTDTASAIVQRLALKYPEGVLFRNKKGNPWTHSALAYRLWRLSKRLGFKVSAYQLRHSWATDAIANGASLPAIAFFLGNSVKMIETVYGHIERKDEFLDAEFKKAVGQ